MDAMIRALLRSGVVIPAHPLALTAQRRFDERRQRALTRYYVDAGAGGVAVGVHTTQFAIRDHGLLRPVLAAAVDASRTWLEREPRPFVLVAGICGTTRQAIAEAELARDLGYHAGLVSLGAFADATDEILIAHCLAVSRVLPVFGFYLQPAVGGRVLGYEFWRRWADIENVCAVKIAPFNRYATSDVVRAVVDSGRDDIALYTGNDDNIVADLLTPFPDARDSAGVRWICGGLLGQWAVWTRTAVTLLDRIKRARSLGVIDATLLHEGAALTDANAAIFDAAGGFAGCIPGIHEILRRQGLMEGTWCLDPREALSPGQAEDLERVVAAYPRLADDDFVEGRLSAWLG